MKRSEDAKGIKTTVKPRSVLPYLRAEQEKEKLKKEEQERKPAPQIEKEIDPELEKYMPHISDDELRLRALLSK